MATRSQPASLKIFSLNLPFDFTLDDEDFEGLLETASTSTTYNKRSYITVCYIRTFSKSPGPEEELYMILLTKERVEF